MRILADFHHSSLFSSLLYTLEARLGHEVYRQIGENWFKKGFWRVNRQSDTIAQYLATYGYQPNDGTPTLNDVKWVKDGVFFSRDPNTGQIHKAIEWETYMAMDWDIVIGSIPEHVKSFSHLAKLREAKFVFQMGNEFPNIEWEYVDYLMGSVFRREYPVEKAVFYHQEFDTNIFKPGQHKPKTIYNFMNVLQNYKMSYKMFNDLEKEMPDYDFKMYGSQNRDGCITGAQNLANKMQEAEWIFHYKPGGDGYGHVFFNAFAVGTPMLVMAGEYGGKLGGTMLNEKKNCLMIDGMDVKQIAERIRGHEDHRERISQKAYNTFKGTVNFEQEAKDIQKFLEEICQSSSS